jgi:hypothetical protein
VKTLETGLRVQNRTLCQVKREGNVAIYEQGIHGFEVIVIRVRKAHEAFGKHFPDMEYYPGNEQWGEYGWTYNAADRAGAEKRFARLLPKWGANSTRPDKRASFAPLEGQYSQTQPSERVAPIYSETNAL